jgi:F-type H+-transporting ATPase subunit a
MSDVLAADIEPGHHITGELFGLTFNLDTIWSTVLAGAVVIVFGLIISRKASSGVPSKPQLIWETLVAQIEQQVEDAIGKKVAPFVVPLAVTLFSFILIANWIEIIPTEETLVSPTADVNLTFAMAFLVIIWVHVFGIRKRGGHYFAHFAKPWYLTPINIIEELAKPVTLALRLFGNIFSGGIMIAVIALMPVYVLWLPTVAWKLFDMAIGVIQAFIFALLTILYFSFAAGGLEEEETAH